MAAMTREGLACIKGTNVVRVSTIVMIGFAVLFGLLAVFIAQSWLTSQDEMRMRNLEANRKPIATQTIVVASRPLRFGAELGASSLREIAWPENAVPAGAFTKISDLLSAGRRVVLTAIEANEPVLSSKVTGPGQRATLSAVIGDGMRAITIRVNDVDGVAGFVLPGDRVDVALTRQADKINTNDVVLQNVKVLAIDQVADERTDKPSIARAVTLEVNAMDAQKVALAATVGSLSLMLRRAGEAKAADTRRVTLGDLANGGPVEEGETARYVTVRVQRAGKRDDVSVPIEDANSTVGAATRGRAAR
jgi:pilus assembly protein CpaB